MSDLFLVKLQHHRITQTIRQSTHPDSQTSSKPKTILKKFSAYAILKNLKKFGQIWNTAKSRQIINQKKSLDICLLIKLALRSFKVTQGQKMPIKGH